jgi:hypothetical protein
MVMMHVHGPYPFCMSLYLVLFIGLFSEEVIRSASKGNRKVSRSASKLAEVSKAVRKVLAKW